MIQFYGSPMSSAGRTHWMLEEVGVPYEYHRVNARAGDTRKPEFLAISPGGLIPVIVDGGFVLTESIAINFYLAEKYRPELMGDGLEERALVQQWSLWAMTNLQPELITVMMHTGLLPEPQRDAKTADAAKTKAGPLLAVLDKALAGKEYLVGNRFTVADLNTGSVVNIARALALLGADHPNASAWMDRLRARPALQKLMQVG